MDRDLQLSSSRSFLPDSQSSERKIPEYVLLQRQMSEASTLVSDVVLKNYLSHLSEMEIIPLDEELCQISDIRLFRITEMVYQKDEYSTYKFASVFNSVQHLNCGIFIVADCDGEKTDFYMGVRSFDSTRTVKSLKDTLRNALRGQFPGVKTSDLMDSNAQTLLDEISSHAKNIAAVSCLARNKDEQLRDNAAFLQGLEKLAAAMQGQRYTAVILAKSVPQEQLLRTRNAYEQIYTNLSPFANLQLSYGTNQALSISEAFSTGTSTSTSSSVSNSISTGTSHSTGETTPNRANAAAKAVVGGAAIVTSFALAALTPLTLLPTALAGSVVSSVLGNAVDAVVPPKSKSDSYSTSESRSASESNSFSESRSESRSNTRGSTTGVSDNMQLTMQNKTLLDTLERIHQQIERMNECESLGMWECGAYFLSDSQETAEMAAGTYRALMRGEKTGVETSAINFWGRRETKKLSELRKYITNFIHPLFSYHATQGIVPVSAASLVSGNELAIQMGLPRKSVNGFPVIEHADFGKEVVRSGTSRENHMFPLGRVFSMGSPTTTPVRLERDSLTMHTFVTGSTGAGKSNTVYEILNQIRIMYGTPFLVVEPAKGEYKNIFGQFPDVTVYGTNPKKFPNLLRLNPFRFPADIHVLEHLDRLVEIFNVCWPMYAAMPAILKESMEQAYQSVGWHLESSENPRGDIFPTFADLLEQIKDVIEQSAYSDENKGNYIGSLVTRVKSLTTGLNALIFSGRDIPDEELFDKSAIVDLSRIGSIETKSLLMGILIMKLNEYRMTSGRTNSPLTHITVLEEAHNLLKRTSTEQSAESSNLLGKSVEMLSNSIAEMRTYGEGFVIADQSPGMLDMSVIRNTNTKIILRLPEQSDRELSGRAAGLNPEQVQELSKLERGVAVVYQNDWIEPLLVQVNRCSIQEKAYSMNGVPVMIDSATVRRHLIAFLIQGRIHERLTFDLDEISHNLDVLSLPANFQRHCENLIAEYQEKGTLRLWLNENFVPLSRDVTELLGIRERVFNHVLKAADHADLTMRLKKTISEQYPDLSTLVLNTLCYCVMLDMAYGGEASERRQAIFYQWNQFMERSADII